MIDTFKCTACGEPVLVMFQAEHATAHIDQMVRTIGTRVMCCVTGSGWYGWVGTVTGVLGTEVSVHLDRMDNDLVADVTVVFDVSDLTVCI